MNKSPNKNYLFITLDSCRYDTFLRARCPNLKSLGPVYKAYANGNYTYASHCAMFVGFTPGNPYIRKPLVNPKIGKLFRMSGSGYVYAKKTDHIVLKGSNIIDGFNRLGYETVGVAAMDWFNPKRETAKVLISDFRSFTFTGIDVAKQARIVKRAIKRSPLPKFVFMNIGETHVPYWFKGAPWDASYNPCEPFSDRNSRRESARRQKACVEFVDNELKEVLDIFSEDNVIVCADHGDCWGENGLWEHGVHHEKTVTVPLLFRVHPLP